MFIGILEGTVISTALPHMARDFEVAPVDLGGGITACLLVSAMFPPISSRGSRGCRAMPEQR
ncbi:MAG: hypothetical protein WC804_20905 [Sphingomonas sp.]|jgi:hypothetical protein|uniref:hypothetical protein n=1 Tax=Sphingomonas sp. TaxID=28214 RepID=UPI00356ADAB3